MACILAFITGSSLENDSKTRVLFIGNSYTYYNSMPQMVKAMAEIKLPGRQIETKFVGAGGATLKKHWETGWALKEIESGKWDYVILQGQSMLGTAVIENGKLYFGKPDLFFTYARKFANVIKENGAEPVFYMTWSRKDHPDQQKYLSYAYMKMAKELNGKIAPVGLVWNRLRDKHLDLYQKDGSHPTIQGSYLAAAILFATIFDIKPIGLPGRLVEHEILRGGKLSTVKTELCDLSDGEVEIIRESSTEIYQEITKNGGYLEVDKAVSNRETSLTTYIFNKLTSAEGQAVVIILIFIILIFLKGIQKTQR